MSSAPCFSHSAFKPSSQPGSGATRPMFPATGSTITAAISAPRASKSAVAAYRSFMWIEAVVAAIVGGTPALAGSPKGARPLPAFTSR